jgi:hypothetical protein
MIQAKEGTKGAGEKENTDTRIMVVPKKVHQRSEKTTKD